MKPRSLFIHALLISFALLAEPVPRIPPGSLWVPASRFVGVEGESWMTEVGPRHTLRHLHGSTSVVFDLGNLELSPGLYYLGFPVRTGTQWNDPDNQLQQYRFSMRREGNGAEFPLPFELLTHPAYHPRRVAGLADSWATWVGTVQTRTPVHLTGKERIHMQNQQNHGGIQGLWIQPVQPLNSVTLTLHTEAKHHAWIKDGPVEFQLHAELRKELSAVEASLHIEWLDLLTGERADEQNPFRIESGEHTQLTIARELPPGVHRLTVSLRNPDGSESEIDNVSGARVLIAVAPSVWARELPDDWPLGVHVSGSIPPLPGFKHFRYFAMWPDIHTGPGVFDWGELDRVFDQVRAVGGHLMLASDGAPLWTSSKEKKGMDWSPNATAHPPDEWLPLREYLQALLERFGDGDTLTALELWNEANTRARWLGTPAQMLAYAEIFREAVTEPPRPIKIIGLAVSAGHHVDFVRNQINAGILDHLDAVSAHFYEELMSFEEETPINNLPRHVSMLEDPMREAGKTLPILNTESGIGFAVREEGEMPAQSELNERAESDPDFDPAQPWLLANRWRDVSERRAAATYVSGTMELMARNVRPSYHYSSFQFILDGAPSLPWVALAQFGSHLRDVDTFEIQPLPAHFSDAGEGHGQTAALAYLVGKPGEKQFIIAWGFLRDHEAGRSKHWQPWLDPRPLRIETGDLSGRFSDLYDRHREQVESRDGVLKILCGEEPVFITLE
ncbi:MAG: hypothetical protein WD708_04080 [Kiritimatiellia bacterium]